MPRRRTRRGGVRRKRGQRSRAAAKRPGARSSRKGGGGSGHVLHSRQLLAADRALFRLRYPIAFQASGAAGHTVGSWRYTWNNAYDLDPTVGSTSTPGFTAASALYTKYRVIGARYNLQVMNRESAEVAVAARLVNTDPSTTGNGWTNSMGPHTALKVLGEASGGQDLKILRGRVSPALIWGERSAQVDPAFVGTVSGTFPTNLQYLGVSVQRVDGTNFATGVDVTGWIEIEVQFFELKQNITTFDVQSDWFDKELHRQHVNILNALSCFKKEYEQRVVLVQDGEQLFYDLCRNHTSKTCPIVPPLSLFSMALRADPKMVDESLEFAKKILKCRPEIRQAVSRLSMEGVAVMTEMKSEMGKVLVRKLSISKLDPLRYASSMRGVVASETQRFTTTGRPAFDPDLKLLTSSTETDVLLPSVPYLQ